MRIVKKLIIIAHCTRANIRQNNTLFFHLINKHINCLLHRTFHFYRLLEYPPVILYLIIFFIDYRNLYSDYYQPPPVMRDVSRLPPPMHPEMRPPIEEEDDNGEVNVVDVLRILTALEERLGSLGPKVIDLLAQALALEKKEANSSETLLDSDINCVLFETIKEKLKGQLLTGLVDMVNERAFKKAIKKIASLMHLASDRKRKRERLVPKVKPVTVAGVGAVDRAAIAKQIATALIAQGKTDVTQGELEQLINAVVSISTIFFKELKLPLYKNYSHHFENNKISAYFSIVILLLFVFKYVA